MVDRPRHTVVYQAALDALALEKAIDSEDHDDMERAALALMRIKRRRDVSVTEPEVATTATRAPSTQPPSQNYALMSVSEAAVAYLSTLPERETKSALEIVSHLAENGYEFGGESPDQSVSASLTRRSENYGDVLRVKRGKWGLKSWYTQKEVTAIKHKERTLAGMKAARERGVRMGQPLRINAEQAAELKRLVAEGFKNTKLAEHFRVSPMTISRYKKLLKDWNPGDPYPPDEQIGDQADQSATPFRVVK